MSYREGCLLNIEKVSIERINPAEYNPRLDLQPGNPDYEHLKKSIDHYDLVEPLVWNGRTGNLVAGHQRLKILQERGDTEVEVSVVDLSPEDEKGLNVALNKIQGDWDLELLSSLLVELEESGFDLDLTGFDQEEIDVLIHLDLQEGLTDPDDIPEPPDEPVTKPGDLWILGDHRLLCGDSGNPEDVDRLLDGAKIHLVNTDPPYNVKVEPRSNNAIAAGLSSFGDQSARHHQRFDQARDKSKAKATTKKMRAKDRPLENDFVSDEEFERLLQAWFGQLARVLDPGRSFYIWGGYANIANYPTALKENGLYSSQAIIWVKEHPVLTRKDFMGNHEWCFYGWKEGAAHKFFGPNNATDVWSVKKVNPQSMVHLTEKPVELAIRAISYSSRSGENVLDLFGGSGSTLIGAEQTGRRAFTMELDAPYCDVIVLRWEQFTGLKAEVVS